MSKQDDAQLFAAEMADVEPLKQDNDKLFLPTKSSQDGQLKRAYAESKDTELDNYLVEDFVQPVDPYDLLSYKKDGVQDGVFKNVRLAKYTINSKINLTQITVSQARTRLFAYIMEQHEKGYRMCLIRHGIGLHNKPFPAVMKSYVNRWLNQIPEVMAFHSAQKQHGGLAATYVYLRKNQYLKQLNKELHRQK